LFGSDSELFYDDVADFIFDGFFQTWWLWLLDKQEGVKNTVSVGNIISFSQPKLFSVPV